LPIYPAFGKLFQKKDVMTALFGVFPLTAGQKTSNFKGSFDAYAGGG